MTSVERMRLEFNEMSRSTSESLAEITAADEYGAAVIKATESNLTKKGGLVFGSHRVDIHHPSRATPHFTNSFQHSSQLGKKKEKKGLRGYVMSYSKDHLTPG